MAAAPAPYTNIGGCAPSTPDDRKAVNMGFDAQFNTAGAGSYFDQASAFHTARVQKALLAATARGAQRLESRLRQEMRGAGLGNLGNAIKATSDEASGRGVHQLGGGGFSAWGLVGVRSKSARTRGAIEAYVGGADIRPKRGRWLWVPSPDIQRLIGKGSARQRVTPGTWASSGMQAKLGPLELIKGVNGRPLLVVKNVGTSLAGGRGSAKSLKKNGTARRGQRARSILIAFVAIPWTARAARIDVNSIHREVMAELPALITAELRKA